MTQPGVITNRLPAIAELLGPSVRDFPGWCTWRRNNHPDDPLTAVIECSRATAAPGVSLSSMPTITSLAVFARKRSMRIW